MKKFNILFSAFLLFLGTAGAVWAIPITSTDNSGNWYTSAPGTRGLSYVDLWFDLTLGSFNPNKIDGLVKMSVLRPYADMRQPWIGADQFGFNPNGGKGKALTHRVKNRVSTFNEISNDGDNSFYFEVQSENEPFVINSLISLSDTEEVFANFSDSDGDFYFNIAHSFADGTLPDGEITTTAPVPEPTVMLLFGTGLIGLSFVTRRRLIRHKSR